MRKLLTALMPLLGLFMAMGGGAWASGPGGIAGTAQVFCVSPIGSDINPGTVASPWLTLDHARTAIETYEAAMTGDIVVLLRGGTYTLSNSIIFTSADSGQNGHSVIWQNYPGEKPVISGGRTITGWTLDTGSVYKATAASLSTRQFFINGVRCIRARGSVPGGTSLSSGGYTWGDSSLSSLARPQDLEMVASNKWTQSREPVGSVSGTAVTMATPAWTYAESTLGSGSVGVPNWIENAREFVTVPGYWYNNAGTGTLYYYPQAGDNLTTATVVCPVRENLVSITGTSVSPVSNIVFKGLSFKYTTWLEPSTTDGFREIQANVYLTTSLSSSLIPRASIEITYATNITFSRCVFAKLGGCGLSLLAGAKNCTVQGNVFTDISGVAIQIGNPNTENPVTADTLSNDTLSNNWIHSCGVEYQGATAIQAWFTKNLLISHNQVNQQPYTGIAIGWGPPTPSNGALNNTIQANLIYNVMQTLNDGGGIYSNNTQAGQIITQNVIHDIPGSNGGVGGTSNIGLYLDDGSRYNTVTGNIVYNCTGYDTQQHNYYGDITFRYNTLAEGTRNDFPDVLTGTNGASPLVYGPNFTLPPSSDPSVLAAAGIEAPYRDILKVAP